MVKNRVSLLAQLPKVDVVLEQPSLTQPAWSRAVAKTAVHQVLSSLRASIRAGECAEVPSAVEVASRAEQLLRKWVTPGPRRVINATGVLLHTNLGRAPLAAAAIEAMVAAGGACDLEIDLASGQRGSRFVGIRPLLSVLIGAPDVHVVNNGAAALLLACTAVGRGGSVAISRGQLVEIGDGFRIAEMAAAGGVRLVEIGSTNRTHLRDYESVLDPSRTDAPVQALLWAHQSNFRQTGFVEQAGLRELSALARKFEVPLIADLGSGSLGGGLPHEEPTIGEYIEQGADLVTCSGDKLLGGPQAGILAGAGDLIAACRRHPLARALRPDKTTLAALHATLALHAAEGDVPALPLHRMFAASLDQLRTRANALCEALGWPASRIVETEATIGGGSLPGDTVPSLAVIVTTERPNQAAKQLRLGSPAVAGRVTDEALLVDLRSLLPEEDEDLVAALRALG